MPVHDRHAHVHQDDVGGQLTADPYRLGPVAGHADDREVRLGVEQRGEAGAHHVVIVGDDDPDRRGNIGHQWRLADWLLRITPAAAFAVQQAMPQYPQVTALYSPSSGYFPLAPWAGLAVLCAYAALALGLAVVLLRRRDA